MNGISDYFVCRNNPRLTPQLSKERQDSVVFFKRMLIVLGVITVINAIIPKTPQKSNTVTITNCQKATEELEKTLSARDAIIPNEAMTTEGRAKWESLRDHGVEAANIRDELCH